MAGLKCTSTINGQALSFVLPLHVVHPKGTMLCDVSIPKHKTGGILHLTMSVSYNGHTTNSTADFRLP